MIIIEAFCSRESLQTKERAVDVIMVNHAAGSYSTAGLYIQFLSIVEISSQKSAV